MMDKLRRFTALCLVLCICMTFAAFASADEGNHLIWTFDETDGTLTIGGVGDVAPITTPDEQPWASIREQITEVHIDPAAQYFAENIAYWFAGCTNLVYAEVPGYWFVVGQDAFKDCTNLQDLVIMTHGTPVIAENAFTCENGADLIVMVNGEDAMAVVTAYPWTGRNVDFGDFSVAHTLPYMPNGHCMNGCNCSSCSWSYAYSQRDADYHWKYAKCDNCSANEYPYGSRQAHSFNSSGRCTVCGYQKSGGGSGGGGGTTPTPSCRHTRTRKEWTGSCTWKEYCRDCGKYLRSGTTHGTYSYGPWEYYTSTQHRSFYSCNDCGEGSYKYASHSTQRQYSQHSATQHSYREYCSTCSSYIGSASYEGHSFSYGSWSSYSTTQHRRTKTCSDCQYSDYDYGSHTDNNRDGKCDTCGYAMSVAVTWNAAANGGTINGVQSTVTNAPIGFSAAAPDVKPEKPGHTFKGWYTAATGGTAHTAVTITKATTFYAQYTPNRYTLTWDLGDGRLLTTSQTYGAALVLPSEPVRDNYRFDGWFTAPDGGTKVTSSTVFKGTANTTYYARWSQTFSVTVPASLPLVIDQDGSVHVSPASIQNKSSGAVTVSGLTVEGVNGWSLVPYSTNMAHEKVDAQLAGFRINGAGTTKRSEAEALTLLGDWHIPQSGTLDLNYDAVISATSKPIIQQEILNLVFILSWDTK